MSNVSGDRVLRIDPSESGLFLGAKKEGEWEEVSSKAFSEAVEKWMVDHDEKSLSGWAKDASNNDVAHFICSNPVIGKYLSRREVEVDKWGVPELNKHEASLYSSDSIWIPFRSKINPAEKKQWAAFNALAKKKGMISGTQDPFCFFNIRGTDDKDLSSILHANEWDDVTENENLKNGVFYWKSEIKCGNEGKSSTNLIDHIEALERCRSVSKYSRDVIVRYLSYARHGVCCAFVLEKKKVREVLVFNSWPDACLKNGTDKDPLVYIKKTVNDGRAQKDKIKVTGIYYGAQGGTVNAWDYDGNCSLYSINSMNALVKLLLDEKSLFHKKLLEGKGLGFLAELNKTRVGVHFAIWWGLFIAGGLILSGLIHLFSGQPFFVFKEIFGVVIGQFVVACFMSAYMLYAYRNDFNLDPLKEELQRALSQYFNEQSWRDAVVGEVRRKSFEKRKLVHIMGRWILGNIAIREYMKQAQAKTP